MLRTAVEQAAFSKGAEKQIDAWKKTADRYQSEPETGEGRKELMERAKAAETRRDLAMRAYYRYEVGSAAVQVAIVLASAAIITGAMALSWIAGGLGIVGLVFCGLALLP